LRTREFRSVDGVLVVDKPAGPTSHDVVERVRRELATRRAGHTGTLDPLATGVLAVCLGQATRLVRFLAAGDKLYRATLRLGFATTTDDVEGAPLGPAAEVCVSTEAVRAACARLVGRQLQVPPAFSAKRVGGRRAYQLARAGKAPALDAVPVDVHRLDLVSIDGDLVQLEVCCSPGTYVRALARDLGGALGVGGHLVALRRLGSGCFGLERAVSWDAIGSDACRDAIVPLSQLLSDYPSARVGAEGREALRHGRELSRALVISGFPEGAPPERVRIVDDAGTLLALAVPRGFSSRALELSVEPVLHPDVVLLRA
jgi:tRNA pseudouridine55 synthase